MFCHHVLDGVRASQRERNERAAGEGGSDVWMDEGRERAREKEREREREWGKEGRAREGGREIKRGSRGTANLDPLVSWHVVGVCGVANQNRTCS